MELRVFTEPQQGATYDDLLRSPRRPSGSASGRSSAPTTTSAMGADGLPGPSDAWVTLAGLARETSTIRLGTLMTSATFRHPGPLAITVASVDQMSGGRVELGLGAGWFEAEHTAYGIPFPGTGERFDRLEEQLAVITGLWASRRATSPTTARTTRSPTRPGCPSRRRPGRRCSSAARGKKRTPALAARVRRRVQPAVRRLEEGLEPRSTGSGGPARRSAATPATLRFSSALVLCVGADEAELERRAAAIGHDMAELRANGLAGTLAGGRRQDRPLRRVGADPALPAGPRPRTTSTTCGWWRARSCRRCDRRAER